MAGVQVLLGGKEDDRISPRACGQDRGGIGHQPCSRFQDAGPTRFGSDSTPTYSTLPNKRAPEPISASVPKRDFDGVSVGII